jgi:hypothetical protein
MYKIQLEKAPNLTNFALDLGQKQTILKFIHFPITSRKKQKNRLFHERGPF